MMFESIDNTVTEMFDKYIVNGNVFLQTFLVNIYFLF